MEKNHYPNLGIASAFFKFLAWIQVIIAGIIILFFLYKTLGMEGELYHIFTMLGVGILGAISYVSCYMLSEVIELAVNLEDNTKETNETLSKILNLLASKESKENFIQQNNENVIPNNENQTPNFTGKTLNDLYTNNRNTQ